MGYDKLVDSTQLDADLLSVANAIRAKSGGSGSLAFPAGFVSEIGNISGGGGGISGTITPASNVRSLTISDAIGKSNLLIFPMFDLVSGQITTRTHWGSVIIGGRAIAQGSTNTSANSYQINVTLAAGTGKVGSADTFDNTTGAVTIVAGATENYGGYFVAGVTYGYVAW